MSKGKDNFFVIDLKDDSYVVLDGKRSDGSSRYGSIGNPLLATRFANEAVNDDNPLLIELREIFPDIKFKLIICEYSSHKVKKCIATMSKKEIFSRFRKK